MVSHSGQAEHKNLRMFPNFCSRISTCGAIQWPYTYPPSGNVNGDNDHQPLVSVVIYLNLIPSEGFEPHFPHDMPWFSATWVRLDGPCEHVAWI